MERRRKKKKKEINIPIEIGGTNFYNFTKTEVIEPILSSISTSGVAIISKNSFAKQAYDTQTVP